MCLHFPTEMVDILSIIDAQYAKVASQVLLKLPKLYPKERTEPEPFATKPFYFCVTRCGLVRNFETKVAPVIVVALSSGNALVSTVKRLLFHLRHSKSL